jgi:hypothetical protein
LRQATGAIHPWLMGGEYLPDRQDNEVEIARITIAFTTRDVTCVRLFRYPYHRLYLWTSCRFAEGRARQRPGSASETGSDSRQSPAVHFQIQ